MARNKPAAPAPAHEMSATEARNAWLLDASRMCAGLLFDVGYPVPANVRVSLGWSSSGVRSKAIGECWTADASGDGHFEIFISPKLGDAVEVLATLAHELCHAVAGIKAGHGRAFGAPARAIGLEGKLTSTYAGDALKAAFAAWIEARGPYPAAALDGATSAKPKQSTRMLKVECPDCGYALRGSRKWLDLAIPSCPLCNTAMVCHGLDADEGEGEAD